MRTPSAAIRFVSAASIASAAILLIGAPAPVATAAAGQSAGAQPVASAPGGASDRLKIVILGSGMGPRVDLAQFGASTLIEAGGIRLLFDCGRGATLRLAQVGVAIGTINRLFLTHLHSDHVIQIPDLLLTGWAGGGRTVPLEVWGPEGTREMMRHLLDAFAFDIHMRRDVDEKRSAEGIKVLGHDIAEGVVFAEQGITVTAFFVDHGLLKPALGYRIDYRGHSVVLSGDTRSSENLIRHAQGADVVVHEVIDAGSNPDATRRHTTAEQAGELFSRIKPRLAVYSHGPGGDNVVRQTRRTYSGPLEAAEDMLTIEIGEAIEVHHVRR